MEGRKRARFVDWDQKRTSNIAAPHALDFSSSKGLNDDEFEVPAFPLRSDSSHAGREIKPGERNVLFPTEGAAGGVCGDVEADVRNIGSWSKLAFLLFDPPVSTRANASRSVGVGANAFCVVPSHAVPSPLTPERPKNLFEAALDTVERMDAAGDEKLDKDEALSSKLGVKLLLEPLLSGVCALLSNEGDTPLTRPSEEPAVTVAERGLESKKDSVRARSLGRLNSLASGFKPPPTLALCPFLSFANQPVRLLLVPCCITKFVSKCVTLSEPLIPSLRSSAIDRLGDAGERLAGVGVNADGAPEPGARPNPLNEALSLRSKITSSSDWKDRDMGDKHCSCWSDDNGERGGIAEEYSAGAVECIPSDSIKLLGMNDDDSGEIGLSSLWSASGEKGAKDEVGTVSLR